MMPLPNEDGGSNGGGTTTTVCTPNPSDNVAILNNLISRISDIERFLSQLVGADVHADNLSELADNIGNILNGTITLPSDGNSPYGPGGSIPVPDGFSGTVVSGNVTTIWENGVVSFQVDNSGIVVGGSGGTTAAMFGNYNASENVGTGAYQNLTLDTTFFDDIGLSLSSNTITGWESGWYLINANCTLGLGTNIDLFRCVVDMTGVYYEVQNKFLFRNALNAGDVVLEEPPDINLCGGTYIEAGSSVRIRAFLLSDCNIRVNSLTFIKMNTTTAPPP